MSGRPKKRLSAIKKTKSKTDDKTSEKTAEVVVSVDIDPKIVILKELLVNLLSTVAEKSEINKSFAKLTFKNSNSYYGGLDAYGFHGFGTYKFTDGTSFKGSFERTLTKGLGRYKYKNGDVYEGDFLAGRIHGHGQYRGKGFQYHGYFKNGVFHGDGVWKSKTREVIGIFYEGKIAHGIVNDESGVFKGTFDKCGLREKGKFTFTNGNTYNGSWACDAFCGFGVYNWIEEGLNSTRAESKYVGYWVNGQRHGLGKLKFHHRCIICQWNSDMKCGAGVIFACNGNIYAGIEVFSKNQYTGAQKIELNNKSRNILLEIVKLTSPCTMGISEVEKSDALIQNIKELVQNHVEWFSPVYPVRIPDYEIGSLPPGPNNSTFELMCLQKVASENYKLFMELYMSYIQSDDECMNNLGLNLFYMDALKQVQDVNIAKSIEAGNLVIRDRCSISDQKTSCDHPLSPVTFNEFFQHFIRITNILMQNYDLKSTAERYRPTFFGHLSIQVLLVLKMLQTQEIQPFVTREALLVNRPAVLNILVALEDQSPGDKTIRSAYRYLRAKGVLNCNRTIFIDAVGRYFKNFYENGYINETDFKVSDLELAEIILYTCHLMLVKEEMRRKKL